VRSLRGALGDALAVIINGLRLVGRHGPTLLVIYLFGSTVRNGVLWASVEVSAHNSTIAGFMLPLAPMATLTAIILMLRVVSTSLSSASFGGETGPNTPTTPWLGLLASTLIPFLTVYAAQGYLKEDIRLFVNEASYDEIYGTAGSFYGHAADSGRTIIADGTLLVGIVVVALVLRFAIDKLDLPSKHTTWGLLAAYVEVLWLFLIARQITKYQDRVWAWVTDRRSVEWVEDRWATLTDAVGPIGDPLRSTAHWLGNVIGDADGIVVIPIAWLTVGAVALGRQIDVPRPTRPASPLLRPVARIPAPVRRIGSEATADLRGRFRGLGDGLRLIVIGGLVPMLLFCLVFIVASQSGVLVTELWRTVVGPLDRDTALAIAPYVNILADAVYSLLLVGLLGAAIDRVVQRRDEHLATEAAGSAA
jgi:hypothetical protein